MDAEKKASAPSKEPKLWLLMRANVWLKYGPMKKCNGNNRRRVESRIFSWKNIAAKLHVNSYKRFKLLSVSKTEYLVPKKAKVPFPAVVLIWKNHHAVASGKL